MLTTAALIDLALNPQIPPFSEPGVKLPKWTDIYPPARFVRACEAARSVGMIGTVLSATELADYIAKIAEVAGLANPAHYPNPFSQQWSEKASFTPSNNVGDNPATGYIGYLTWVHSKFWELRKTAEPLISFYGTNTISQAREAVNYLLGDAGTGWFNAPFHWTSRGTLGSDPDVGTTVATLYSVSLAYYLTLHDLVSRNGALSKRHLPPDSYNLDFWERIRDHVQTAFGGPIW
jgi:hypothetical protein